MYLVAESLKFEKPPEQERNRIKKNLERN